MSGGRKSINGGLRVEEVRLWMQRLSNSGKQAVDCGMKFGDPKLGATFTHCYRGVKSPEVVSCHLVELKYLVSS